MVNKTEFSMEQHHLITIDFKLNKMEKDKKVTKQKKYALVQLPIEVHTQLKQYTEYHGFKMSGFIAALIRQALKNGK